MIGPTPPVPRLLVATNDFPPNVGGAERYVHDLVRHLPADRVTVLAPRAPGWRGFDAGEPYRTVRYSAGTLAPTPSVSRRIRSLLAETRSEAVLFGHGFPLGLLAPGLARDPAVPIAMLTHGWELWFARIPGTRGLIRRATASCRVVFTVSQHMKDQLRGAIAPGVPSFPLTPGVDTGRFHPSVDGRAVRARHDLGDRPVVACISRLVPRKGQDALLRAWPAVRERVPDAVLLLVGDGPYRRRLEELAAPLGHAVRFAGEVAEEDLPAHYAACDVFAMPCRDERGGLEVEGLGIVYLEAAAAGKPVIAGRSGGAPETVEEGETGLVVDGRRLDDLAGGLVTLLADPALRERMGAAGRTRAERAYGWDAVVGRFAAALSAPAPAAGA